uniref:G-protein coupled receptors family 1 profile domain-containing protein n=1 Tax=Electrophorus electricus TaxID=8005 RepID=A0A4W4DNW1_ELEEL
MNATNNNDNIVSIFIKEVRTGPGNIFLFSFLSCISVCTVFLNLLVILSISHFKQLHTPTNLLILSLAVADLLVGLVFMPVNTMQLRDSCWYLGKMACTIVLIINFISMSASLCNMVFIAVDRYIAVSDPLLYSTKVTVRKMSLFIILGWSCSLLYILIYLYFNDHLLPSQILSRCHGECILFIKSSLVTTDLVISFICPCSVILILYSIIFTLARRATLRQLHVVSVLAQKKSLTFYYFLFYYLFCLFCYSFSGLLVCLVKNKNLPISQYNPDVIGKFYLWSFFLEIGSLF